ncbi:ricin-type beta-trefoil lectin domain protein [Pseudomonas lurida]|uniref:RICIN domain-containing protein n=1 Tax=Pseudomonas lurida TaxID=244566 RepID=UPI0016569085|nr:RICIN domain-containing protein [Pseudomonas lurida]MBC8982358.1 ricin-type beta-trefoil lectin domain protein [Pseudomonas lurida]
MAGENLNGNGEEGEKEQDNFRPGIAKNGQSHSTNKTASDLDDLEKITPEEIHERIDRVMLKKHALDMRRAEKETEDEAAGFDKENRDRRTQLLKAVTATTPDLRARLFEKMEALEYEGHEFTSQEKTELLKAQSAALKDAQDFFDLTLAQRDDLFDRVGFYRGIIIDHSLTTPIDVSFREVLRRPDFNSSAQDESELSAATVLYRKPVFSGYFENYFTFSEAIHQTQKSGVTNLSFSLSAAAGGLVASAGLGVAAAYGKQEQSNTGSIGKTSYTTANFFLPRIELSFDEFTPCASQGFYEKCQRAMADGSDQEKFKALKKVLDYYGHFVSTRTLVGGRLFATQSKVFDGKEDKSSLTERFALQVQASLSAPKVDVELKVGAETATQVDSKKKSSSESQSSSFHAVGGEGIVVQDAARWAESLYDYKRWAAVQRENLIPSIDVLPEALADDCWDMLKRYAKARTKRSLLYEDNAWFLFYGAYGETVGCLASDVYFTINNRNNDALLSLASDVEVEGTAIVWKKVNGAPDRSQLWRMTEDGHLVSLVTRPMGAWGARREAQFAVTPEKYADGQDVYSLVAHQLGSADNQAWEYAGSGEITNKGVGRGHALLASTENKVSLEIRSEESRSDRLWQLEEAPLFLVETLSKEAASGASVSWFKLRLAEGRLVLSINGAEGLESLPSTSQNTVIAQPDINGIHQMWCMDSKGRLISAVKAQDSSNLIDLFLSANVKTKALVVSPESEALAQRWTLRNDQLITSNHAALANNLVIALAQDANDATGGNPLVMRAKSESSKQKWDRISIGQTPGYTPYKQILASAEKSDEWAKMIDRQELVISGKIVSLNFKLTKRGKIWSINEGYSIQLSATVVKDSKGVVVRTHPDPKDDCVLEIASEPVIGVDTQFLYLPDEPIHSIKLDVKPNSRQLCFQYKLKPDSEWVYTADDVMVGTPQLHVSSTSLSKVESLNGQSLLAVGLHFDSSKNLLAPKAIIKN